jgi:hypothetical protein
MRMGTLGLMMPRMWRRREVMMTWKRWTPAHMKIPKRLHIIVLIHLSCIITIFTVSGLQVETARDRTFGPQTADAYRTELADGVSNMRDLPELLLPGLHFRYERP